MRPATALVLSLVLVPGSVLAACGDTDATDQPDVAASASPSGDRAARRAERCEELLPDVALRYRITATPGADGAEIGLWMRIANRSPAQLSGSTGGTLVVEPGPRTNRISWGGSSADQLWQKPGSTSRHQIWHDRRPPGWHPVGDRVTSFEFYADVYAPGPGLVACPLTAAVVAPPGLVDGHPSGRWRQESSAP